MCFKHISEIVADNADNLKLLSWDKSHIVSNILQNIKYISKQERFNSKLPKLRKDKVKTVSTNPLFQGLPQ